MRDEAPPHRGRDVRRARGSRAARWRASFSSSALIGFGGPAAHIALMEDEVVRRRRWLTREQFLDLLGATNLIPGPNSTEMAIHVGFARAGWPGLVAGGACFILPAMLITLALAAAYARYGRLPEAGWILYGVKPVIIAVVVQAVWGLARKAIATPLAAAVALAVLVLSLRGANEVAAPVRGGAGLAPAPRRRDGRRRPSAGPGRARSASPSRARPACPRPRAPRPARAPSSRSSRSSSSRSARSSSGAATSSSRSSGRTWSSGRAGSPTRSCWTPSRSASSRPGPSSRPRRSSATSWPGRRGRSWRPRRSSCRPSSSWRCRARSIPRLRRSPWAGGFLDGANAASVALMAAVTWELGRAAVVDWLTAALAAGGRRHPAQHPAQLRVARGRRRGGGGPRRPAPVSGPAAAGAARAPTAQLTGGVEILHAVLRCQ